MIAAEQLRFENGEKLQGGQAVGLTSTQEMTTIQGQISKDVVWIAGSRTSPAGSGL